MSRRILLLTVALLGLTVAATGCDVDKELKTPVYKTGIKADETRASAFKEQFPLQYASYRKNDESTVMTEYKGSVPFHKNDNVNPLPKGYKHAQPYLKNLWLGYPFMYEYNEARGHTHAVEDFVNIDRINRYAFADTLARPVAEVVPPILEHSRKLQQDPAHLAGNPWLKLLPVLPRAEQVWDGDKRIRN